MRRLLHLVVAFAGAGCLCSDLQLEHDLRPVEVSSTPDAGTVDAGAAPDAGVDAGARDAGFVPRPCIAGTFTAFPAEPVVMLLLDRSSSMGVAFSATQTRWEAVLSSLVATLPAQDATMQIGGVAFPNLGENAPACRVPQPMEPSRGNARRFISSVANRQPEGETPTTAAVILATGVLRKRRASNVARAMVLATDGEPTCTASPVTALVDYLERSAAAGIPTWVVGLTGDPALETSLNAMARAGSRPLSGGRAFYAAQSATELEAAFAAIRDQVSACSFLTESVPDRDGGITISFGGVEVPSDDGGVSGWRWTDRENGEFAFLGASCTQAIANPSSVVVTVSCGR